MLAEPLQPTGHTRDAIRSHLMQRPLALVFALVALGGCQAIKDKLARRDKDAGSAGSGAASVVLAPSGAPTGKMIVPGEWPTYLPLYPKAKLLGSAGDARQKSVLQDVGATAEEVTSFYADKLESAGYGEKRLSFYGPSATLVMRKDAALVTVTVVGGNGEKQTVTLTFVTSAPRPNLDAGIWRAAALASAKAAAAPSGSATQDGVPPGKPTSTAPAKPRMMPAAPTPTF